MNDMVDVRPAHGLAVHGAPEGFDALLLARRRAETDAPVLHVCRDDARMARLAEAVGFFAPGVEVMRFPAWDCLPYDRVSPNAEIVAERVATLTRLLEPGSRPRILVTTVNALVQRVPPRDVFAGSTMELKRGGRVQPERLAAFLEANGYNRTGTVMEPGEYALRGGIVDLFPAGEPTRCASTCSATRSRGCAASTPARSGAARRWTGCCCGRSARCSWTRTRSPASGALGATCSAPRRRRTRSTSRSAPGGGTPASSIGRGCSTSGWRPCWTTCRARRSRSTTKPRTCWRRGWR
jgi:hypothetical protein